MPPASAVRAMAPIRVLALYFTSKKPRRKISAATIAQPLVFGLYGKGLSVRALGWSLRDPLRSGNGLLVPGDSLHVLGNGLDVLGNGLVALANGLPVLGNGAVLCLLRRSIHKTSV